jgi:tRNA nucleotidyltransferase (CCA-adding enzyme)
LKWSSRLEKHAASILDTLINNQFQAYWVGGYVRDRLLGRAIQDIDIATSAKPDEVMALFERCEPTGLQHGTVLVIMNGLPFEVTTFREETGYEDFRRPAEVVFIQDIQGDLSRRDFTMNAMAIDRSGRLIDPFGGEEDLRQGVLRCVGDPHMRFGEDALRILRCVRFAAEYRLTIEEQTWNALLTQAPLLKHIAMERVRTELERIVMGSDPGRGFQLFIESDLYRHFKSGTTIPFEYLAKVEQEKLSAIFTAIEESTVRWSLLFLVMCMSSEQASVAMRTLTFSNQKLAEISAIISVHEWCLMDSDDLSKPSNLESILKLSAVRYGLVATRLWLKMITLGIDLIQGGIPHPSDWSKIALQGERWLQELPVYHLRDLKIKGTDLINHGYIPGPDIGEILNKLLQETALGLVDNEKQQLLLRANELIAGKSDQE